MIQVYIEIIFILIVLDRIYQENKAKVMAKRMFVADRSPEHVSVRSPIEAAPERPVMVDCGTQSEKKKSKYHDFIALLISLGCMTVENDD